MCDFTFLVLKLVHIFPQQELMKVLYVRFEIVKIIDFEFNLSLKTSDKFRQVKLIFAKLKNIGSPINIISILKVARVWRFYSRLGQFDN